MTDRTSPVLTGGQNPHFGYDSNKNRTAVGLDASRLQHVGSLIDTAVDIPDRYESFLLGEGEKKVEVEQETRKYIFATAHTAYILTHSPKASQMPPCSLSIKRTTP